MTVDTAGHVEERAIQLDHLSEGDIPLEYRLDDPRRHAAEDGQASPGEKRVIPDKRAWVGGFVIGFYAGWAFVMLLEYIVDRMYQ